MSIALLVLCAVPSIALASDPTGLVYVGVLQVVLLSWPLILPLLYLGPQKNKLRSYFLSVILTYGTLGIAGLPDALFTNVTAWTASGDSSYRWFVPLNLAKHIVAFAFCVWYLPRFRKLLRTDHATEANHSSH